LYASAISAPASQLIPITHKSNDGGSFASSRKPLEKVTTNLLGYFDFGDSRIPERCLKRLDVPVDAVSCTSPGYQKALIHEPFLNSCAKVFHSASSISHSQ